MNKVPHIMIVLIFLLDYLVEKLNLPGLLNWLPELLSAGLFVILVIRVAATKSIYISTKYVVLFGFLLIHITSGLVLNDLDEGPIIAGLRYYLKFFPFFLLPAVIDFSDIQIKSQLLLILFLGLLQLPVTLYQRFFEFANIASGDSVSGTLGVSSMLSVCLVGTILILLAFFLKKRISSGLTLVLTVLLFIPCLLGETKATIVFLPLGAIVILLVGRRTNFDLQKILGAFSVVLVLLIFFVSAYDQIYSRYGDDGGFLSFMSGSGVESYLYQDVEFDPDILTKHRDNSSLISEQQEMEVRMPRIDRLIAPFAILHGEPVQLLFGLGIGNVSDFRFADYRGEYAYLSRLYEVETLTVSLLLWELGLIGTFIYMLFFYFIFDDCRRLSSHKGISGCLATGWVGVLAMFFLSLFYVNTLQFNIAGFLFTYLSGYLATAGYKAKRYPKSEII